jgi:AraC-like DNA-binding protein
MASPSRQMAELAALITRRFPHDGIHETAIERMSLIRASHPNEPIHAVHQPAVCVIAQGSKQLILGDQVYTYDPSHYLVVSVDLPLSARVTRATPQSPYLCFRLDIEPGEIATLALQSGLSTSARSSSPGMYLAQPDPLLLDAVVRLVRLLETPEDIATLAPLTRREILYRLLKGEQGWRLQQIATAGSHAQRISRAIDWLKAHFAQPLRIEHLAREVHMSTSSLHHQFKAVTSMSPLQYQKRLRLQEARRLMLSEAVDAATAGFRVGYESPSQFGREYNRLFGAPPARDLRRLRQQLGASAALSDPEAQNLTS